MFYRCLSFKKQRTYRVNFHKLIEIGPFLSTKIVFYKPIHEDEETTLPCSRASQ